MCSLMKAFETRGARDQTTQVDCALSTFPRAQRQRARTELWHSNCGTETQGRTSDLACGGAWCVFIKLISTVSVNIRDRSHAHAGRVPGAGRCARPSSRRQPDNARLGSRVPGSRAAQRARPAPLRGGSRLRAIAFVVVLVVTSGPLNGRPASREMVAWR